MAGRLTYRQFCEGGADPGAASLSPTPGGIGVVEVAMVAALAAVGVKGPHAITAVLVYRVISLKGAVSLWAVLYRQLHRRRLRAATARFPAA
jgi:uncharacterized membrane protein YbhN (UPF0104 family)